MSFQILKDELTHASILTLSGGFVVYSNASGIVYAFKQLKTHEKNYPAHSSLELRVKVFALKMQKILCMELNLIYFLITNQLNIYSPRNNWIKGKDDDSNI